MERKFAVRYCLPELEYEQLHLNIDYMSKSLQSFNGKVRSLKTHVQLADVAFTRINHICSRKRGNGKSIGETLGISTAKHPQLNEPNESIEINKFFYYFKDKN